MSSTAKNLFTTNHRTEAFWVCGTVLVVTKAAKAPESYTESGLYLAS